MLKVFAVVGGTTFATQAAMTARARSILNDTPIGGFVGADDWFFLVQLLRRQPAGEGLIGPGVAAFQVRENVADTGLKARGFWGIRPDGEEFKFSYLKCLPGGPPNATAHFVENVKAACRFAVAPLVVEHKRKAFDGAKKVPCEETGVLVDWHNAEVDHGGDHPFARIVDEWLCARRPWFWQIKIERGPDGFRRVFTDPLAEADFREHHDAVAKLRVVSREANGRLGARGYVATFVPPEREAAA